MRAADAGAAAAASGFGASRRRTRNGCSMSGGGGSARAADREQLPQCRVCIGIAERREVDTRDGAVRADPRAHDDRGRRRGGTRVQHARLEIAVQLIARITAPSATLRSPARSTPRSARIPVAAPAPCAIRRAHGGCSRFCRRTWPSFLSMGRRPAFRSRHAAASPARRTPCTDVKRRVWHTRVEWCGPFGAGSPDGQAPGRAASAVARRARHNAARRAGKRMENGKRSKETPGSGW